MQHCVSVCFLLSIVTEGKKPMNLYIKEMTDSTALLMTDVGQVIATFGSVDDAVSECTDWMQANDFYADYTELFYEY